MTDDVASINALLKQSIVDDALNTIREISKKVDNGNYRGKDTEFAYAMGAVLAHFYYLDRTLSEEGVLPTDWHGAHGGEE